LEYDFYIAGFTTKDQTVISDHLTQVGIKQMVQQRAFPDVMWLVRSDGKFLGFTYSRPESDNYQAWHRHYLGGNSLLNANGQIQPFATINSVAVAPRNNTSDQLWFSVQRTINGQTVCSVEYLADYQQYPQLRDYFTGDVVNDPIRFNNALYQTQLNAIYLDMANVFDGSALGSADNITLTPSAVSGSAITITASAAFFTSAMIGQQIRNSFDGNDNGNGWAEIVSITDSQHAVCNVLVPFSTVDGMAPGSWYLTATVLNGLNYLNGETVFVVTDGGPAGQFVVANGQITLIGPVSTAVVGYPYTGTLEYLNVDSGGKSGSAESKPRVLIKAAINFLNSLGAQFGTSYYDLQQLSFRAADFITDRPTPPFTGIKMVDYIGDTWADPQDDPQKILVIIQQLPLPCTVLSVDPYFNTSDE
jgi:hypothetical protein